MESTYKYCANCNAAQLQASKSCSNCAHDLSKNIPSQEVIYQIEGKSSTFFFNYKEVICLFVFAVLLSVAGFAFYTRFEKETQSLSNKLSDIDRKLDSLETKAKFKSTGDDNDEILSKLNDVESQLSEVKDEIESVKSDVSDIQNTVNDVQSTADSIQLKVGY